MFLYTIEELAAIVLNIPTFIPDINIKITKIANLFSIDPDKDTPKSDMHKYTLSLNVLNIWLLALKTFNFGILMPHLNNWINKNQTFQQPTRSGY